MVKSLLTIEIEILDEKAKNPAKETENDIGYDLQPIGIHKLIGDVIIFKTGLSLNKNSKYLGFLYPKSSIYEHPLDLAGSPILVEPGKEILIPIRVFHTQQGNHSPTDVYPSGIVKMLGKTPTNLEDLANLIIFNKLALAQLVLLDKKVLYTPTPTIKVEAGSVIKVLE